MPTIITGIISAINSASITAKIIASVVAVTVVGGGTTAVVIVTQNNNQQEQATENREDDSKTEENDEKPNEDENTGEEAKDEDNQTDTDTSSRSAGVGSNGNSSSSSTPPKPDYNLNEGYYLGVKKFGGANSYKEGYYPTDCDWSAVGSIVHSDGRECGNEYYKTIDEGVVVLNNLCAVETAVKNFTTAQSNKAIAAGYHYLRAGVGANAGCDDPGRIASEKIDEAKCNQYGLSCGRW